jgi:hypothetical protein
MFGFEKYIDIGGYNDSSWDDRQVLLHGPLMDKVASDNYTPESLLRIADTLKPRDDGVYVLLNALGADEYWGQNRNGDAFPQWSLKGEPAPAEIAAMLTKKLPERDLRWSQPPPNSYGTKTFEDYAHVYSLHDNKDPDKRIGDVTAAAYNDKMRRTELIVFIMRDRDPATVAQVEAGEPVPFSMGARLPFDVCAVCHNVARNRAQYCDHLKSMLRRILPNGQRCVALNFFPRFFDISKVRKPADPSAWSLRKVAEDARMIKSSTMIKREPTMSAKEVQPRVTDPAMNAFIKERLNDDIASQEMLSKKALFMLKEAGLSRAVSHCAALGIILSNDEMRLVMGSDKLTKTASTNFGTLNRDLLNALTPFVASRSMFEPHFSKRAAASKKEKNQPYVPPSARQSDSHMFAELFDVPTMNKLAAAVDNDMTIRFAIEPDIYSRVVTPTDSNPKWLPFLLATYNR